MLIVFFRAMILYAVIIFSIRLMGKKQLGELQPSEFVVTIMLSNIATLPIEDVDIPLSMGLVPIFTFVCIDVLFSFLALRSRKLRRLICGSPKIIISNGKLDQRTMRELRYTVDDLFAALRAQQVFDIAEVQLAVVETTGQISVYVRQGVQPLTPEDICAEKKEADPPSLIINDGDISRRALEHIGRDGKWLKGVLRNKNLKPSEVLIMTSDGKDNTVIPKESFLKKERTANDEKK